MSGSVRPTCTASPTRFTIVLATRSPVAASRITQGPEGFKYTFPSFLNRNRIKGVGRPTTSRPVTAPAYTSVPTIVAAMWMDIRERKLTAPACVLAGRSVKLTRESNCPAALVGMLTVYSICVVAPPAIAISERPSTSHGHKVPRGADRSNVPTSKTTGCARSLVSLMAPRIISPGLPFR
ncbi:MAG: hypothetical protein BWY59_01220 [Verrucomicrobia bacterium ADurb.Bin345]|nr:MAG: hypothetical protein BWY59_01220 [Verrucomicrobia bacterium ADurb.Bin345]